MKLVTGPARPLHGLVAAGPNSRLPGDKSISHRAALFASLAKGDSVIHNFQVSGVTRPMLQALSQLGVVWNLEARTLTVQGRGFSGLIAPQEAIDCGNSATTLRLLAGALAAARLSAVLDGSPGLRRRPMGRIVEPLQAMGVPIQASSGGTAPLQLGPWHNLHQLTPLDHHLPVASAQVKSCLLLAGLGAEGPTILHEPGPSRDHTERLLTGMGVTISYNQSLIRDDNPRAWTVQLDPPGPASLLPLRLEVPGDFSAAAFLIVAALIIPGSEIGLQGVGLNPTRTGLLDALQLMGADIEIANQTTMQGEPRGDLTVRHSVLHGITVAGDLVVRMIDEFPIFAVAAAFAGGPTRVDEADELRHKESDRIAQLAGELRKLGVGVTETEHGFTISGEGRPGGGQVQSHGDHRLAMSLTIAGLAAQAPVEVQDAGVFSESFPEFLTVLGELGADNLMTSSFVSAGDGT